MCLIILIIFFFYLFGISGSTSHNNSYFKHLLCVGYYPKYFTYIISFDYNSSFVG